MEVLRNEMIDDHNVQFGDLIYELYQWLVIHRPDAQEVYIEGDNPVFYYGPKESIK